MKLIKNIKKLNFLNLILKGSSISFIINVFNLITAFLIQLLIARLVGVESFGYYSFVTTFLAFLVLPSKLGLDTATTRFVSAYNANEELGKIKGILKMSNRIVLLIASSMTIIGLVTLYFIESLGFELKLTFAIGLLNLPFMALTVLRQNALQAYKKIFQAQAPEKIFRPLILIILILITVNFFEDSKNSYTMISLLLVASLISFTIGAIFLKKKIGNTLTTVNSVFETSYWLRTSLPLMFVSGMYLMLGQLDILMLGALIDTNSSGFYSVAVKITSFITFGIAAVNLIAAPLISENFTKNKIEELKKVCAVSTLLGSTFALLATLGVMIFSDLILNMFGNDFKVAQVALIILSLSQLVNIVSGQATTIMKMTGQQKSQSVILFITVLINVILNLCLIPILGIEGAAWATLISTIVWNLLMIIFVKRKMGFNPSLISMLKFLR